VTRPLPFRLGGYGCIAADPPWPYEDQANRMACDYPVMSVEEIIRMEVASLTSDVSHLYLWTSSAFIEPAYAVARAWGYQPADLFPWINRRILSLELKDLLDFVPTGILRSLDKRVREARWQLRGPLQIGGGHRIRHAAEYVLLAIRGEPRSFPTNRRFAGVIEAPAKGKGLRHSQKPVELYRRALLTSPGPHQELIPRVPREELTTWGNEVSG
jgi:N6-adenosine-specific RNA methylase IME4